jgi:hypothetical protein
MSFWRQSPGPHWSHSFKSLLGSTANPHIFQKTFPKPDFSYDVFTAQQSPEIVIFLAQHYKIFPRSRVSLTANELSSCMTEKGWIGVGIRQENSLIGLVFLRPLGFMMNHDGSIENEKGALVDFYCVHSDSRKKGVGSKLLHALAYEGSQKGYLMYFFVKEGIPLPTLPALRLSSYVWRPKHNPMPVNLKEYVKPMVQPIVPRRRELWNVPQLPPSATVYECSSPVFTPPIYVCVTPMYHTSELDRKTMGEILWVWYDKQKGSHSDQKVTRVIETVADICSYEMIFLDKSIPHDENLWIPDATYSWYSFNFHPARFFSSDIAFTF